MAPYLDIRNYAVDTEIGNIRRDQENRSLYQKEYRKHEKQTRDYAYGKNKGDDQGSQGFLQNLVMDLNNTGNAFAQQPFPQEREERSSKKDDRRGREKSEDRRRDDWGQLF